MEGTSDLLYLPLPSAPSSGLRVAYCVQHDLFVVSRKTTYEKVRTSEGELADLLGSRKDTLLASRVRASGSAFSNASRL